MDGAVCVGVFVALDMLASRKQCRKALARKRRLDRARRKADFCSEAGPRMTFLHASAVHAGIQLLFAYQNTMEEGKKLILVGPCCKQHFLSSLLA